MHTYQVKVKWDSGRTGTLSSEKLSEQIKVATPPEFPGGIENVWSPEHYYTAAVCSCYMTTFLSVAENLKLEFKSFACNAEGILEKVEGKWMMTKVILFPVLCLLNEEQKVKAERILQKAEEHCLISNSIKSTVELNPQILIPENC